MENATRTIYGSYIQTCLFFGLQPEFKASSTLNEKLGINATTLPSQNDKVSLAYYVIGNGGHQLAVGANGVPKPEPVQHRATDAALYSQLPFVLREVNNDLSPAERVKYALRKEEVHNSVRYIAYYARRIDKTNLIPTMEYKVVNSGQETVTPFTPNSSNLSPIPPTMVNSGVNTVDGDYTTASARVSLVLTADDMTELLNVGNIIYNDSGFAIISEIGLCTGVDKVIAVTAENGGTFNFNDAIGVQIASHIPTMIPANFSNNGTSISLDVGATEPLWSLGSVV